jgi:endoglucanase
MRPARRRALSLCVSAAALLVLPGLAVPAWAQSTDCTLLSQGTVPAARVSALARGFNLTGWLDGPETRRPDMAALAALHQRGFTHVRLPVAPERLMDQFSAAADAARARSELDEAIDRLILMGFAVSLDLHPGERLGRLHVAAPERAFALLDALWRDLARHYARYPIDHLFFEVLNEPGVSRTIWESQGPRLAATIRQNAPRHTIIYGTTDFQQIAALPDTPLALPDVVYAVHYYAPMVFTHQGQSWSEDPLRDLHGVPFPAARTDPAVDRLTRELRASGRTAAADLLAQALRAPWDETRVAAEVARAGQWSRQHGVPVVINEFGVLAWKTPAPDRLRWLRTVRRAAEQACVGWAHWDYADAFGFMRRVGSTDIPDQAVLKALLGD